MSSPTFDIRIVTPPERAPAQAVDLLGHEAEDAFDHAGEGVEPALIAAVTPEGEWMASILMHLQGDDGERVASIRQLVVKPEHRGRGVAGWLLRRAHHLAEQRDCARIRSTAGWGCPDHRAMYHRLGYSDAREGLYLVSKLLS